MSTKNLLSLKDSQSLHHAYLVTGDIAKNLEAVRLIAEKFLGATVRSCPDYFECRVPKFSIDDGRELIERQKTRSFSGGKRFFVIASDSFTLEAENGLLKVLEEPILDNHFFILIPNEELLLPTIRSRLMQVDGQGLVYGEWKDWCDKFLAAELTSRVIMIEKFLKEMDKDDEKSAKHKTLELLSQLEKVFSEKIKMVEAGGSLGVARFLTELLKMKSYLDDTAPAPRLILEYIAFICP